MRAQLLVALVALSPLVTHVAFGCDGRPFGATVKRYVDSTPPRSYYLGMPEGHAAPTHLITVSFESWGCGSAFAIDLDTSRVWQRLRCASVEDFEQTLALKRWEGARLQTYTDFSGGASQEAVKEGRLALSAVQQLVCLANDAWGLGKWGDPAKLDAQGGLIEDDAFREAIQPHGMSVILLKDADTTRTLGMYYHPSPKNADGMLQNAVYDAVTAAVQ